MRISKKDDCKGFFSFRFLLEVRGENGEGKTHSEGRNGKMIVHSNYSSNLEFGIQTPSRIGDDDCLSSQTSKDSNWKDYIFRIVSFVGVEL